MTPNGIHTIESLNDPRVAISATEARYPERPPFHPHQSYPEYPFAEAIASERNNSYDAVRTALHLLGLDSGGYGMPDWNPLGELVSPGDTVLLKPNFIRDSHALRPDEWEQVITNGSVIRAVLDYVYIALKGSGRVIIADGPQTDSDYDAIARRIGLNEIVQFFEAKGLNIQALDLRRDRWYSRGDVIYKREQLPGDPAGYTTVDLGEGSEFAGYNLSGKFYGADYNMQETAEFHSGGRHTYILCRSVVDADVVINLPKMKTHKKTGVTISLKNMVGINGYRNCLPHHTIGTPDGGGDEFPGAGVANSIQSKAIVTFKKALAAVGGSGGGVARLVKRAGKIVFGDTNQVVRSGNWYGNDTAWRMVLDLNKSLFYFNGDGRRRTKPLRYMTFVDGIIAGSGNGPIAPDAEPTGVIVAGFNPVATDTVCAALMGFDYRKIPVTANGWRSTHFPLAGFTPDSIQCASNTERLNGSVNDVEAATDTRFKPHFGWVGHIERDAQPTAAAA